MKRINVRNIAFVLSYGVPQTLLDLEQLVDHCRRDGKTPGFAIVMAEPWIYEERDPGAALTNFGSNKMPVSLQRLQSFAYIMTLAGGKKERKNKKELVGLSEIRRSVGGFIGCAGAYVIGRSRAKSECGRFSGSKLSDWPGNRGKSTAHGTDVEFR